MMFTWQHLIPLELAPRASLTEQVASESLQELVCGGGYEEAKPVRVLAVAVQQIGSGHVADISLKQTVPQVRVQQLPAAAH